MLADWRLRRYADSVAQGGVIAYPTEAVFGLGCDPANEQAISRLLELKRRAASKGLILIAASVEQLRPWVTLPGGDTGARILGSWPGPVTWLLPVRAGVSPLLTGSHETLAVRVTAHPLAAALCRACGPLVSTSANLAGQTASTTALQVRLRFGQQLTAIVPGATGGNAAPSQIFDAASGRRLR